MRVIAAAFVLGLLATSSAFAKDIAICGASEGYGYYPNIGLGKPGEWVRDGIKEGRFTLTRVGDRLTCYSPMQPGPLSPLLTTEGASFK
jgi:hypothetical protein